MGREQGHLTIQDGAPSAMPGVPSLTQLWLIFYREPITLLLMGQWKGSLLVVRMVSVDPNTPYTQI